MFVCYLPHVSASLCVDHFVFEGCSEGMDQYADSSETSGDTNGSLNINFKTSSLRDRGTN